MAADSRVGGFAEGTRLLDAMSTRAPRVASDIAARAGLSIAEVQALLGQLELTGAVGEREQGVAQSRAQSRVSGAWHPSR